MHARSLVRRWQHPEMMDRGPASHRGSDDSQSRKEIMIQPDCEACISPCFVPSPSSEQCMGQGLVEDAPLRERGPAATARPGGARRGGE
jgi:hypothetical protein